MALIFWSSFDAGLGAWTLSSGVTIVPGRTLNGANITSGSSLRKQQAGITGTAVGTSTDGTIFTFIVGDYYAGAAISASILAGKLITLDEYTNNNVNVGLQHLGDGRLQIFLQAWTGGTAVSAPSKFVMNLGQFYFFELYYHVVNVIILPDPSDPTKVSVSAQLHVDAFVNNVNIFPTGGFLGGSGFDYLGGATVGITQVRDFFVDSLGQGGVFEIWDDVYIDSTANHGDGTVDAADTTYTVNTVQPRVTQMLLELNQVPPVDVRITQMLLEIIYAPAVGVMSRSRIGPTGYSFV